MVSNVLVELWNRFSTIVSRVAVGVKLTCSFVYPHLIVVAMCMYVSLTLGCCLQGACGAGKFLCCYPRPNRGDVTSHNNGACSLTVLPTLTQLTISLLCNVLSLDHQILAKLVIFVIIVL